MAMTTRLSAQDLLLFLLVERSILLARVRDLTKESEEDTCDRSKGMHVLKFLCTHIRVGWCAQPESFAEFIAALNEVVQDQAMVARLQAYYRSVDTSEKMDERMESGRTLFEIDGDTSQNNLIGPNTIAKNSIMGVFVRTVLAKWDCMMFDEVCDTFDQFHAFVAAEPVKDVSSTSKRGRPSQQLLHSAERMLHRQNVAEAEDLIHKYYDSITDPSSLQLRFLGRDNGYRTNSFLHSLQAATRADADKIYLAKNQHGMMSLAVMHMHAQNWAQTAIAIEEALKTAHQRGDHASVAKCLLFLHQLSLSRGDLSKEESEDLIRRSMARAANNNLNELVANAAVLLAAFKSRSMAATTTTEAGGAAIRTTESSQWAADEAWTLFNYALHGETSLILQFAASQSVTTNLDECLISSNINPAALMRHQPTQQQVGAPATNESPSIIDADYVQRYIAASLHLVEHWMAQERPFLAAWVLMRAVRSFGDRCDPLDLLTLLTKLLDVKLELLAGEAPERLVAFLETVELVRGEMQSQVPPEVLDGLRVVATKAVLLQAATQEDWARVDHSVAELLSLVGSKGCDPISMRRCRAVALAARGALSRSSAFLRVEATAAWDDMCREYEKLDCSYLLGERFLLFVQRKLQCRGCQ